MSRLEHPLSKGVAVLLVAAAPILTPGCGEPETPPPVSLDGPTQMAFARTCLVGERPDRVRVDLARCEAGEFEGQETSTVDYGYVTNAFGHSLAVINFNLRRPELIDIDPSVPGITHIPVGTQPREVAASSDGNVIFTLNAGSRDISIVSGVTWEEVGRVPVDAASAGLVTSSSHPAAYVMLPAQGRVMRLNYEVTCDGTDVITSECAISVATSLEEVYTFDPDSVPTRLTMGPAGDRLYLTFARRSHLVELLLDVPEEGEAADDEAEMDEEPPTCLDGRAEAPCVIGRYGLTWECNDGIDNDGDGLADASDPDCFEPDDAESPGGVGRRQDTACADGLDNDGDGLIDSADSGCLSTSDASETGAVLAVACSDGVDNDGDGTIDAEDPECQLPADGSWTPAWITEAARPACSDGVDNDDDGRVDGDDNDCLAPTQGDEGRKPACGDRVDNDGDGLIDLEDPDCDDPLLNAEDGSIGACNDGVDNDGDGAIDLDDPACGSLETASEYLAPGTCGDGRDNDGDGLTDVDDPDCYGVSGGTEATVDPFAFGPVDVDPGGRFAYVVDRTNNQVVVVDLQEGRTIDVAEGRPYDSRIGIPVGRLPLSVTARRLETTASTSLDGRYQVERSTLFANVATTRGFIYYLQIADIWRATDDGEVVEELFNPVMRVSDADNTDGLVGQPRCTIPARLADAVAADDGSLPDCDGGILPRLATLEDPDPDDEVPAPQVALTPRTRSYIAIDEATQAPVVESETFPDGFYLRDETWTLDYAGTISQPSDLEVVEPGVLRSRGTNFCSAGARDGDLFTLGTGLVPRVVDDQEPDCSAFEDVDLTWRVEQRSASYLFLRPLSDEEAATLGRAADAAPLVAELPTRECFAQGLSGEVWSEDTWVVTGENSGKFVNQTSIGQACIPRFDTDNYGFRATTGETFSNPFFTLQLEAGQVDPTRGFVIEFNLDDRYRALAIDGTGPSPVELRAVEARGRSYLGVLDGGTNVIRIYDGETNALLNVLF